MAQPAVNGRSNILTKLDQRVPTRFYWQLTLLATLGGFLFGYERRILGRR
jgi:MFS transporter, SP family, arabinose:H+ symporter